MKKGLEKATVLILYSKIRTVAFNFSFFFFAPERGDQGLALDLPEALPLDSAKGFALGTHQEHAPLDSR